MMTWVLMPRAHFWHLPSSCSSFCTDHELLPSRLGTGARRRRSDNHLPRRPSDRPRRRARVPDVFGLDSGRAKQDADRLGELGYAVAFVDLTGGDYAYDGWDMLTWMEKQDFETVLLPRILEAIQYLKNNAQVETLASYGYCWGAWVGARLSVEQGPLVQGHVSFHPSWMVEVKLYGDGSVDKLAEKVLVAQLLLSAGNDQPSVQGGGSVQTILSARDAAVSKFSRVVDFPDVKHGWVNRGDVEDPAVKEAVDTAWTLASEFIHNVTA